MPRTPEAAAPVRTCVGCRSRRPQPELVRVARRDDGSLTVGRTLAGRGAWLCRDDPTCLDLAARRGGFDRAFRTSIDRRRVENLRTDLLASSGRTGPDFVPDDPAARN